MAPGYRKALAIVAVGALTGFVHGRMPSAAAPTEDDAFVPRPEVAHVSAFGFDAVVSDYYWLQAVQIIGVGQRIEEHGALLGALIDVVTTLDPWVSHPYRFAAVWLTGDLANIRKANELLRRGIEYHPDDWRNRFYLGFNLFFYLDEYEAAATVLEEAMELPNAPLYLRRLVARLKGKAESLELAETFLHGLLLEAQSEDERVQYQAALDEIATERAARTLDAARETYVKRHGRDIDAVEDLARGPDPVLPALPREPQGGGWTLDGSTGRIVSDVLKHRYEAKVDETNRKRIEGTRSRDGGEAG
jgi:tetratricopeptide (TPR) repeat protein